MAGPKCLAVAYSGLYRPVAVLAGMALIMPLASAPALALGWRRAETIPGPAPYVLQVVAADLDGDGRDELVVAGRNYEQQQDRLYVMACAGVRAGSETAGLCRPAEKLAGPAYTGPLGHVSLTVADLLGSGRPQLLLTRGNRLELWALEGGTLRSRWQGAYPTPVEHVAALRVPDGPVMMATAVVITRPRWAKRLEVASWTGDGFEPVGSAEPAELIRALVAADLVGDGQGRLIVEAGSGNEPGVFEVWEWDGGALRRRTSQALRDAPVFALAAGAVTGDDRREDVLVADDRGRVGLYKWSEQGFAPVGEPESLGWSLVSAALGDLDGDGVLEAAVVEYPNLIHLLRWRP